MFNLQLDTCKTDLAKKIKEEDLKNCEDFHRGQKRSKALQDHGQTETEVRMIVPEKQF